VDFPSKAGAFIEGHFCSFIRISLPVERGGKSRNITSIKLVSDRLSFQQLLCGHGGGVWAGRMLWFNPSRHLSTTQPLAHSPDGMGGRTGRVKVRKLML